VQFAGFGLQFDAVLWGYDFAYDFDIGHVPDGF
jgi:hypothetical protein